MAFLTYVKSTTASWTKSSADLVVFGIFKDQTMTSTGNEINKHLNNAVTKGIECGGIKGKEGECNKFFGENKIGFAENNFVFPEKFFSAKKTFFGEKKFFRR